MKRESLVRRPVELKSHYDAIVIGSGYGGAVVSARLAEAGLDVCVLERGQEHRPGDFAESAPGFLKNSSAQLPFGRVGRADALYRFHLGPHLGALTGVGVGGTSLINAGVMLKPKSLSVLPVDVSRSDSLEGGYEAANATLRPAPVPTRHVFGRSEAIARSGHATFERVPLAVSYEAGQSAAGVPLAACTHCGNCITGCNVGAKGSLDTNYLPLAVRHGAEVFSGADVLRVFRAEGRWAVEVSFDELRRERFEDTPLRVTAGIVVVAAGALGSTELLWRSRARGLSVSSSLGTRFSGNGTILGFTVGTADEMNALGEASQRASGNVGPTLVGMFDLRDTEQPMVIQDTAIPRPLSLMARGLAGALGPGSNRRVVAWSVTAGDRGAGRLIVRDGRLELDWPHVGREQMARAVDEQLSRIALALGGKHRPNPAWRWLPGAPLITTHPLGGCAMGASGRDAVVDHQHRVFAGDSDEVHDGLFVCDGSVFQGALGTNPLWTIAALAERCAANIIASTGKTSVARQPERIEPVTGVCFTERMTGWLSPTAALEPAPSPQPPDASPFSFLLTVEWPSVEVLSRRADVFAASVGTLRCPLLSSEPLTVARGRFQLFIDAPGGQRMQHEFVATSVTGERFLCLGHKRIEDDPGPDLWHDTRTLFVEVFRLKGEARTLVGRGVVQTHPLDLAAQVTTIRGVTPSVSADLAARASFLSTFLGRVRSVYGGLIVPLVR